jgi:aryl-alcohol dehydrogenase
VLVRVVASGICHTDLGARAGHLPIPEPPSVFGHEGAGIVEKVGARVASTAPARGLPKTKRPTRWGGASGVLGELFHQPPSGGPNR